MPIFVIKSNNSAVEISQEMTLGHLSSHSGSQGVQYYQNQVVFCQSPHSPTLTNEDAQILDEIFRSMDNDLFFKIINYVENFDDVPPSQ